VRRWHLPGLTNVGHKVERGMMQTLFKRQGDHDIYRVLGIKEVFSDMGAVIASWLGGEKANLLGEDFLQ
jgi:hypothetical protein